ncbi:MAG: glutamine-hydrolyzing GMP synthase, partial [Oscillospiraceae bacterium]|nr:glutamine-hydrolyzing GMP synthase [Oscillospiraceae bacterium]
MSKILVLDFGGQYKELIARRIRSLNVYSEIISGNSTAEEILGKKPDGIILTGGPNSVYLPDSQLCAPELFNIGIPVLGICYGMQLMVHTLGGRVAKGDVSEFGVVNAVYRGEPRDVLMSHGDRVWELPEGFTVTASTKDCPIAAAENPQRKLYAVQFHPEVTLTERGTEIIEDFLFNVCGVQRDYFLDDVIETLCAQIREQVGNDKILLGLSGG